MGGTPEAQWTVGAVARRLGLAPATLRTWDRRYGLGPSQHRAGSHRRYTEADLRRLQRMADLVRQGIATADAARATLHEDPPEASPRLPAGTVPAIAAVDPAARSPLPSQRWRRGISKAAMALDADTVLHRVEQVLHTRGVVAAWDELLRPVLVEAGLRWQVTGEGVDIEHMLSDCIAAALQTVITAAPAPFDTRPSLLACAADELHQLPLVALRAALAERRVKVSLLGAATPPEALAAATRRVGPASVVVWSQLRHTADAALFEAVPVLRPRVRLFAGGDGWSDARLPPQVGMLESISEAVVALAEAAGLGVATSAGQERGPG